MLNLDELDKLDHLWQPPTSGDHHVGTPDQLKIPSVQLITTLGYDIPRSLIETNTIEQSLRYENELQTTPIKKFAEQHQQHMENSAADAAGRTPPACDFRKLIDTSHYDTPINRRKSYIDMSGIGRISHIGYNLDVAKNLNEKKLSKDLSFRFSSLVDLSEQMKI